MPTNLPVREAPKRCCTVIKRFFSFIFKLENEFKQMKMFFKAGKCAQKWKMQLNYIPLKRRQRIFPVQPYKPHSSTILISKRSHHLFLSECFCCAGAAAVNAFNDALFAINCVIQKLYVCMWVTPVFVCVCFWSDWLIKTKLYNINQMGFQQRKNALEKSFNAKWRPIAIAFSARERERARAKESPYTRA